MEPTYTENTFVGPPTFEQMRELNTRIAKLEADNTTKDNYIQSVDRRLTRSLNQIESFRQALVNCVKRGEIDPDQANYFASCFDFDIRREFTFTGTVNFEGTVYLPLDVDPDDLCLDDYIQFDFNSYDNVEIELGGHSCEIDDLEEV